MSHKRIINPPELAAPKGFSHGIMVEGGKVLALAGQDASDSAGSIVAPGDIVGQYDQVLKNLKAVVEAAGGTMQDIIKLNIFVTDRAVYRARLRPIGEIHREHFGRYYPAIALFEVKSLFNDDALVEIEGWAHIEEKTRG